MTQYEETCGSGKKYNHVVVNSLFYKSLRVFSKNKKIEKIAILYAKCVHELKVYVHIFI